MPRVWASGDSQVSQVGGSPLIEEGAKMFSLPIVCRSIGADGFFSNIYFAHSFGYCFAGSTLMGQNSFLSAGPLLMTLVSEDQCIPSMEDVAHYLLRFMSKSHDHYKAVAQSGAQFEAAIFGWCHSAKALGAWHFKPSCASGIWKLVVEKCDFHLPGRFLYLGDYKDHAQAELAQVISSGLNNERAPRSVIQNLIKDPNFSSIGGDEQLAMANEFGFQPYLLARPIETGSPTGKITYLGIELTDEFASVGKARVGGPAIA